MELIRQTKESGRLYVNKLSAAERQLSAAIRMYFLEEDELAIHVVASAALNLYADLLRMRGKDPALHGIVYGLFRAARDYLAGELSDEDLSEWGEGALEALQPAIDILRVNPDFDIEEMSVSGPAQFVRDYWSGKRKSYNFLKHANQDADVLLDEADINNEDIILQAIGSSAHLNCQLSTEKEAFVAAMSAFGHIRYENTDQPLIWIFKAHSREEIMHLARRNLCYSRVDDDLDIDFEAAGENAKILLNEQLKKEGKT